MPPAGATLVPFITVAELQAALDQRFDSCDALVMSAAVGDFTVQSPSTTKLRRSAGPVTIELVPTEDILAGLARRRRKGQVLIGFAVQDFDASAADPVAGAESAARAELTAKGIDYVVVNPPAAMAAGESQAAIVSRAGMVLPWGRRSKDELANEIVALLGR
jgi:phosphopantothenoylcysteine decarboxylase/phosphopantothenate--cysteine ligase